MVTLSVQMVTYVPLSGLHEPIVLAKRYFLSGHEDPNGLTFVLMHGTGSGKESWDLMIEGLFSLNLDNDSEVRICDVWSIEDPDQGESAVKNESLYPYGDRDDIIWSPEEYTKAVHSFLTAGPNAGAKVDFTKRRLVGVGHSIGGCALVLVPRMDARLRFVGLILVEAAIYGDRPERRQLVKKMSSYVWQKRDTWANWGKAVEFFKSQPGFQNWPERALDIHLRSTLRPHPASKSPPPYNFDGVTLSLSRAREVAHIRSPQVVTSGPEELSVVSRTIPVHLVFGEIHDIGPAIFKQDQIDMTEGKAASVSWIAGAGHMLPLEAPQQLARVILDSLRYKSRL